MKSNRTGHIPVMKSEVIDALNVKELAHLQNESSKIPKFIDATLGTGGHTIEILNSGGSVLGIDADSKMIDIAIANIAEACPASSTDASFRAIHGNFSDIRKLAVENDSDKVDGILFDLGISSVHLDYDDRGFSYKDPTHPLDMRLDKDGLTVTAADLVNALPKNKLVKLFELVLDYKDSRILAGAIVENRDTKKIESVGDFIEIVRKSHIGMRNKKIDPATKPMMALRMAVNLELEVLKEALKKSLSLLRTGGRMVVISFHSSEDKIVKSVFRKMVDDEEAKMQIKKAITPSEKELKINRRTRSAKLRVVEKI